MVLEEVPCVVCGTPTSGKCDDTPTCFECYESGRLAEWFKAREKQCTVSSPSST